MPAGQKPGPIAQQSQARHFGRIAHAPIVIGVNHRADQPVDHLLPQIEAALGMDNPHLVPFDVTDSSAARDAIVELLIDILHYETFKGLAA